MQKEFNYKVQIKESHLDTFGHVNNAAYLTLLEEARWELITKNGYSLQKVHELKKGPVVLEVKMQFLKELKLREFINIQTHSVSFEGKIGKLSQTIYNQNNEKACQADFVFGFFDLATRKLIPATDLWLKAIGLK
ncbi:MAG: acyl-CoA thioesterase [Oligoflexia bacterium]|nr:acyl-CoA thioesterase [Oligoflexia bacterium]